MDLKSLRKLPRLGQVWFADRRPSNIEILGLESPDLILWTDDGGMVRGFELVLSPAGAAEAFVSSLASAATTPVSGCVPGLPAEVRVLDPEAVAPLAGVLEPLGIPVSAARKNAGLDDAFSAFCREAELLHDEEPRRQRSGTADLFQLRVELRGTEVQRTVVLPSDCTLADLHEVIQDAMGWEDCHLYGFTVKKERYGPDDGDLPDDEVELREVLPRVRSKLVYHYDFGDDWIHDVILEKRLKPTDHAPEIDVLAGAGACPPEDCGGIPGYFSMIEALSTPRHPDKAHWREWIGKFDPKKFDLKKAQKRVREGLE